LAAPRRRVRGAVGGGAPAPHARCVVAPETNRRAGRLAALDGPAWRLPCARPRHPNGHRHRGAVRKSVYGRPPAATQPAARSRPRQERRCGVRGAPPRHFAPRARRRSSVAHVPTSPRRAARCPTATARRPATATRAPSRRCHCHQPDTLPQTWTTAQSVLDARLGPLAAPPTRPAAWRPRGRAAGSRFWSTESQQASTAPVAPYDKILIFLEIGQTEIWPLEVFYNSKVSQKPPRTGPSSTIPKVEEKYARMHVTISSWYSVILTWR